MDDLQDRTRAQIQKVIQSSGQTRATYKGSAAQIASLYRSFMNEGEIETLGGRPLQNDLTKILETSTKSQVARLMGTAQSGLGGTLFLLSVSLDEKDPTHYALGARQGGLSLPSRDYYLQAPFADKKAGFRNYVEKMLTLAGWLNPSQNADRILAFETRIAEKSWTISASQQLEKTYHPMSIHKLSTMAPGFDWTSWLQGAKVGNARRIVVRQDTAFLAIAKVFAETDLDRLKAWMAFRLIDKMAPYLSKRFADARFEFRGKVLFGSLEQRPRWQRGVDLVSDSLGEVVGKVYVARYFPPSSKGRLERLVSQLKSALRHRIKSVSWMTPKTRREALKKLDALGQKLGYPDRWRNYSALTIESKDLVGNIERTAAFDWNHDRAKIGKAPDRYEWDATPQTVNGFYDEKRNEIVVPAAILQPPFFDARADEAVNFGAIGAVIGHEMTHGFDSQGRKTNANGRLFDWWQPVDAKRFNDRATRLGNQYDSYYVGENAHVNGEQTMSENIADLGGILTALDAYHASLRGHPAPVRDGFTGDQRVFLGWAQILRSKSRPEALINQVTTDPHSPDRFRTIGPLRNVDAWYRAFGVTSRDKFYLAARQRVRIW